MSDGAANVIIYAFMGFAALAAIAHLISPRKGGGGSDRSGFDGM